MTKETIYKDIIKTLAYIELAVNDSKRFSVIRKQLLDVANEVLRLDTGSDTNG